jgi:3-oxoacyl-[acyl-carrier protein] reductase
MTDLNLKVAIVTGGARGIGAAVVRGLAADGARVIVNYSHSERPANEVVENIKSDGSEAKTVRADMSDPASTKRLFDQTIEAFSRLDILVNNAGIFALKPLEECSDEDFNDMCNLNVRAVFLAVREAAKLM